MPGAALGRRMKATLTSMLDQHAVVYTRAASPGGTYSVVANASLPCLLQEIAAQPPATGPQRAELADTALLYFDPAYTMPETAQVEVDSRPGIRFNVVAGTVVPDVGPGGIVVMRHCDVRRAR